MAAAKTLVLITGANSGIGYELAAQLVSKGTYHVLLGSRSSEKGHAAVKTIQDRSVNHADSVELLSIDVTKDDTITQAAETVESQHERLDVLINNAAVAGTDAPLRQQMQEAFNTNATGPAVVTEAFAPLLKKSSATDPSPCIVNISSGAGSINRRLDTSSALYKMKGVYDYRASKAALNMITACQWAEYAEHGIKVFAYDPGFTVSNLSFRNTASNGAREAADSVLPLIDLIEGKRDHEAGKFLHNTGSYPW